MDTIYDDTGERIARQVRFESQARDWSLSDLADRSHVSKAAISKIEREELSPTAVILVRLAGAFDLTLAGLLVRAEGRKTSTRGRRPPPSRCGAIPHQAIRADSFSAGPIIPSS